MIRFYRPSLIISLTITMLGAMFKIMHWTGASFLLTTGLIMSLIYIVIALIEIYQTESKTLIEKLLWLIGFICFSWLVGLIYYYTELKPKNRKNASAQHRI